MSETPSSFSLRDLLARIRRRAPWWSRTPDIERRDVSAERLRAQVRVVRESLGPDVASAPSANTSRRTEDDAATEYLYRRQHVLVREGEDFAILDRFFREREREFDGTLDRTELPAPPGLLVARVPNRADGADAVLRTLDELDRLHPERSRRRDPIATPDHVLYVTVRPRLCPYTEPEEPPSPEPVPPVAPSQQIGAGVRVAVVDTGWWEEAGTIISWLSGVAADPPDVEQVNPEDIHPYAGHGTFVAGVLRCIAPGTRVEVEGFAPKGGGAAFESEICAQLCEALVDNDLPQIISISAGTHTRNSLPLLAFELLAKAKSLLDPRNKVLVVAAAGNDTSTEPFYPAALDWVVGVGSVGPSGTISSFSNSGPWVDVYARGENLVNAFPEGRYVCYEPDNISNGVPDVRHFRGMARWSGTSFATPIVAGAVAARMSELGTTDPRKAYQELVKAAPTKTDAKHGSYQIIGPL